MKRQLPLTKTQVHAFIQEAKSLVADEEEPFKTAAFQVLLSQLLSSEAHSGSTTVIEKSVEAEETPAGISVPEGMVNYISSLGDPEKIPILWSMSNKEWMKVDDFLSAAAEVGMTVAKSWSPKQGGNFNNRLYKDRKLFVKRGEGTEARYKLSAEGKQKVNELLESSAEKS